MVIKQTLSYKSHRDELMVQQSKLQISLIKKLLQIYTTTTRFAYPKNYSSDQTVFL